jgi:hypothetical protein
LLSWQWVYKKYVDWYNRPTPEMRTLVLMNYSKTKIPLLLQSHSGLLAGFFFVRKIRTHVRVFGDKITGMRG